jgi:hypothetical protein
VLPFNLTSGIDVQTVQYGAYLYKWNGSSWVYTGVGVISSALVDDYNASSKSERDADFTIPGSGYFAVAVYYNWIRADTGGQVMQPYWFFAPVTESNGSSASYCTF